MVGIRKCLKRLRRGKGRPKKDRANEPDVEIINTLRKGAIAIYLKYPYRKCKRLRGETFNWICVNEECPAKMTYNRRRNCVRIIQGHNHDEPDLAFVENEKFRIKLRKRAIEDLFTSFPEIYKEEYQKWDTTEEIRQTFPKYTEVFRGMETAQKKARKEITVGPDFFKTELGKRYLKLKYEENNSIVSFIVAKRHARLLVYDGFMFYHEKTSNLGTSWTCSSKEIGCKARVLFKHNNLMRVNFFGCHSHGPANKEFLDPDFADKLRDQVANVSNENDEFKIYIHKMPPVKPNYIEFDWLEKQVNEARAQSILPPLPSTPLNSLVSGSKGPTSKQTISSERIDPKINAEPPKQLQSFPPLRLPNPNDSVPSTSTKEIITPDLKPSIGVQTILYKLNSVKQEIVTEAPSSACTSALLAGPSHLEPQVVIKQEIIDLDENLEDSAVSQSSTCSRDSPGFESSNLSMNSSNHALDRHSSLDGSSEFSEDNNSQFGNFSSLRKGVIRPRQDTTSKNDPSEDYSEPEAKRPRDQFDAFGEFVDEKLRTLDRKTSSYVQKTIANLLFEAELGQTLTPKEKANLLERRNAVINGLHEAV